MDKQALKKISKRLSYVLRHRPDSVGLELEEGGWLRVDDLLAALASNGKTKASNSVARVTEGDMPLVTPIAIVSKHGKRLWYLLNKWLLR